jgi:hypothetical protein
VREDEEVSMKSTSEVEKKAEMAIDQEEGPSEIVEEESKFEHLKRPFDFSPMPERALDDLKDQLNAGTFKSTQVEQACIKLIGDIGFQVMKTKGLISQKADFQEDYVDALLTKVALNTLAKNGYKKMRQLAIKKSALSFSLYREILEVKATEAC